MPRDHIDFISSYCDRWCERCAFTERCANYSVRIATGMCEGDHDAAIELAIGVAQPVGKPRDQALSEGLLRELGDVVVSDLDLDEHHRLECARRARLERLPLTGMTDTYTRRAVGWLQAHGESPEGTTDSALREAFAIVGWDVWLIGAKIHRALRGRDAARTGEWPADHRVQNDWNGSAKVALLLLSRSERAWRAIADATGDEQAAILADGLRLLTRAVEREFPDAMAFVRPGFDEGDDS